MSASFACLVKRVELSLMMTCWALWWLEPFFNLLENKQFLCQHIVVHHLQLLRLNFQLAWQVVRITVTSHLADLLFCFVHGALSRVLRPVFGWRGLRLFVNSISTLCRRRMSRPRLNQVARTRQPPYQILLHALKLIKTHLFQRLILSTSSVSLLVALESNETLGKLLDLVFKFWEFSNNFLLRDSICRISWLFF